MLDHWQCDPNKLTVARSFKFGRASAPMAPHAVQTMRGPKDDAVAWRQRRTLLRGCFKPGPALKASRNCSTQLAGFWTYKGSPSCGNECTTESCRSGHPSNSLNSWPNKSLYPRYGRRNGEPKPDGGEIINIEHRGNFPSALVNRITDHDRGITSAYIHGDVSVRTFAAVCCFGTPTQRQGTH